MTKLKHKHINFSQKNKYGGLVEVSSFSLFSNSRKFPLYLEFMNRSVDEIPDTRAAWLDNNHNLHPEADEINYFNIDEIIQEEFGIRISTIRFFEPYTIGFTIKPSITNIAEFWSYGLAFDMATLIQMTKNINLLV